MHGASFSGAASVTQAHPEVLDRCLRSITVSYFLFLCSFDPSAVDVIASNMPVYKGVNPST